MQTISPKTPEVKAIKEALLSKASIRMDLTDIERRIMAQMKDQK